MSVVYDLEIHCFGILRDAEANKTSEIGASESLEEQGAPGLSVL